MSIPEDWKYITRYKQRDFEKLLTQGYGSKFTEYRCHRVHSAQHCLAGEKPLVRYLETNAHCNLKCKMFQHSHFGDKKAYRPMHLIAKAAEECTALGFPSVMVGASTEYLIHPDITTIMALYNCLYMHDLFVSAEGVQPTGNSAQHLIALQVERLNMSLDAATPGTYRTIRGGKLELVENNIHRFLGLCEITQSEQPLLRFSFVVQAYNLHEYDTFYGKSKDKADVIDFQDEVDFTPLVQLRQFAVPPFTCPGSHQKSATSWDVTAYPYGSIYLRFPLCNIATMSLEAAWQIRNTRMLRETLPAGGDADSPPQLSGHNTTAQTATRMTQLRARQAPPLAWGADRAAPRWRPRKSAPVRGQGTKP